VSLVGLSLRFPHCVDGLHEHRIMSPVPLWFHVILATITELELAMVVVLQRLALALFLLRIDVLTLR